MTEAPSDAIGLSERLRFDAARCEIHFSKGVASNIEEAATALDALQADLQVKEQAVADMARTIAAFQAKVKELEVVIAHTDYRSDNCDAENYSLYNRLTAAESRATSAEQERDEAYELAAKVAEGLQCRNCNSVVPSGDGIGLCCGRPDYDSISDVPDAIRRLAAGTEKEKRE